MRLVFLRLLRDPAALVGLIILTLLLVVSIFGEVLAPFPEDAFDAKPWQRLLPPSAEHPFGTDGIGADVLSRIILGARIALMIALSVVTASMIIGVAAGLYAGYRGGPLGELIMRVTDVFLSVPQLVLALVLTASLGAGLETAMVALAISYWPFFCRIVYGEAQRISASLFVEALEGAGLSSWRITMFHILPNAAPAIIVRATIGMGITILTAAALGFMGLGAEPPTPEWGLMIADARRYLPGAWWVSTFPGLAILLTVLAFNLVGDSLRDIIDPAHQAVAMSGAPILDIDGVSVTVRTEDAELGILDRVSLKVEQGQVMGLVGESGCGKSTLVKSILGVLPKGARISSGRIGFGDLDLMTLSQRRMVREIRGRRIALIPQDPMLALNPLFTIGTQLQDILKAHFRERDGNSSFRERCIEMLGRVRLPDPEAALRRYPHQLSGGQRQRVAIAAALLCEPDIILADEPTTALDVTTQSQILALLRDLTDDLSLTIVFVTHDFGVVSQICSHVTVMYAGQTVETGDRHSVLRDPKHPYTKALINCHPDLQQELVGIPGSVPGVGQWPSGCRFHPRCEFARDECATRDAHLVNIGPNRKIDCILAETSS